MDQKKRGLFSMAVILLIFAALLISFGRPLFLTNTPSVVLPDVSQNDSSGTQGESESPQNFGQTVSVTPKTVQQVIETLQRTDSYSREVTVEQIWPNGSSSTTVTVWSDGGWTHSMRQLPNGISRHDLVGPEIAYYWYVGSDRVETIPVDDRSADLSQRVPTYETVLELDPDSITAAGYELKNDLPCIRVEYAVPDSADVQRYWVSVDNGLLMCAEVRRGEDVVYRMNAAAMQSPCPADAEFTLPDGTVLHTP